MQTITVKSFQDDRRIYVADSPVTFEIHESSVKTHDQIKIFYFIEDENFNLSIFGDSLEELESNLYAELLFNWKTYAMSSEEHLTEKAKEVRVKYLETFKETIPC